MSEMDRRRFLRLSATAGGAALMAGCRCPFCGCCERVPYGDTIGDRLWMWGHHADSFASMKGDPRPLQRGHVLVLAWQERRHDRGSSRQAPRLDWRRKIGPARAVHVGLRRTQGDVWIGHGNPACGDFASSVSESDRRRNLPLHAARRHEPRRGECVQGLDT